MNILFLSLLDIKSFEENNIYNDLINELINRNNSIYVVSPTERRNNEKTNVIEIGSSKILRIRTGNIQKTNLIEKGISTILIEKQFKNAIKKHFKGIKFDLILYATPPITFCNVIKYFKNRDNAKTYLMLKDIFPQNAVDLGMFKKNSIIYKYFRFKEKKLYMISDIIGCMSPRNVEYLLKKNSYIEVNKVEVFPNAINPCVQNKRNDKINKVYRKKYNIPMSSKVFIYGGNLGRPQGIPFIIECLDRVKDIDDAFFVICGTGTEYKKLEQYKNENNIDNLLLINGLPKIEYSRFLNVADVGLIFLDYKFTIPNFPSRILSYMEKGIPVFACTDISTDIGDIIENNNFGWKCYSNNSNNFKKVILKILKMNNKELSELGNNGLNYLNNNYKSSDIVNKIIKTNRRKIVVVDFAASIGGAMTVLREYYQKAKNDKNNDYIFILSDNYLSETENIKVVNLKRYKKWINRLLFDFILGRRIINNFFADEVLSLQNTCIRGVKAKQTIYVHQSIPFQNIKKFSFFRKNEIKYAIIQYFIGFCIKSSIKYVDTVIVQTSWMKKAVIEQCNISENKIKVDTPIIDFHFSNYYKKSNSINFFYPTSKLLYKNIDIIYEAVKLLNDEGVNNFKVEITIDGVSTNNIICIGNISREEVFEKYCNSILVFPSYIETVGLPLLEAKKCNTPIIASDTAFSHELLDSYDNVNFFDPFDVNDLKNQMKKFILK